MSAPSFTLEDLRRILVERVGLAPQDVPDHDDIAFTDIGLDSLAVVEVQLSVEQEYGFTISDMEASGLVTLRDAITYVNERLADVEVIAHGSYR